jgi:hypothetical protein
MQAAELVILWGSFGLAAYAYVVYPLLIGLTSRLFGERETAPELNGARTFAWPKITLLIPARRDESVIEERLRNASALNYPSDRLEILVGCDGDEDLTALLARSCEDQRVKVVQLPESRGMAAVLNECAARATGEILIFSAANTMMRPDALRRMARHFQDANIGAVCGKLLPIDPTTGRNVSGLLSKFEEFLNRREARLGTLSRINRGIYAVRKALFRPFPETATQSAAIPRREPGQSCRLIYDDTAIAVEERPPAVEAKLEARITNGLERRRSLQQLAPLLTRRSRAIGFSCRMHKRLRQCCLAFLIAAFVSNACLSNDPFYLRLMLLHEAFYLTALIALFIATGNRWRRAVRLPIGLFAKLARAVALGLQRLPGRRRAAAETPRG